MPIRRFIRESAFNLARHDLAIFLQEHEADLLVVFRDEMQRLDATGCDQDIFPGQRHALTNAHAFRYPVPQCRVAGARAIIERGPAVIRHDAIHCFLYRPHGKYAGIGQSPGKGNNVRFFGQLQQFGYSNRRRQVRYAARETLLPVHGLFLPCL